MEAREDANGIVIKCPILGDSCFVMSISHSRWLSSHTMCPQLAAPAGTSSCPHQQPKPCGAAPALCLTVMGLRVGCLRLRQEGDDDVCKAFKGLRGTESMQL